VIDHLVVEVLAAEVGVSCSGLHLKNSLLDGEKRHVKGAAAEVEDENLFFFAFGVETVGYCRSGGLIDDAEAVEAGNGGSCGGKFESGISYQECESAPLTPTLTYHP
jgi:hypothetical protein